MGGSVICKVAAHQLGNETVGRIVGLKTLGDDEIIDEALRKAYVSGQANIILGNFCGVMKSMVDSSRRDGNGRKIDSVCSESGTMKNGEYPDAKLVLRYYKDDAGGSPELIEVPVGIKVTMGQEDWPE